MDTSESGSETIELLKCGSDEEWKYQLERPCEKQRRITRSRGGNECPKQNKTKTADWIGHNLRGNCLIKHVTEGKIRDGKMRKKTEAATEWTFRKPGDTGN